MIADPASHRGRATQRPMHAAEIVEREPQHHCRAVVDEALRKRDTDLAEYPRALEPTVKPL